MTTPYTYKTTWSANSIRIDTAQHGVYVRIADDSNRFRAITLPAEERREAAQALAGDRYRVVLISEYELTTDRPLEQAHEDLHAILDALGLDVTGRPYGPHECVTRDVLPAIKRLRGMINTLTYQGEALRAEVAELRGREAERCPACNHEPDRPEPDFLKSAQDAHARVTRAGYSIDPPQPDRPEPVDPASGAGLIAAERVRQVSDEGYAAEHDDRHDDGQLVQAAATYVCEDFAMWPWSGPPKFTSNNRVRELVKAGALIAAEIDRMHRAEPEPDPAAVEALAEQLHDTDDTNVARWGALSEVVRDGYRDQARRLIRRGVEVPSDA